MTESLVLIAPVLLVAAAAAAFLLRRPKPLAAPTAVAPPPPIEMAPPPGVSALQGDLLQLRFDAQIAGLSAARDALDATLDRLFEVAARTAGGASVVDALRETVRERLRPAALADDPAAVQAAHGPLEEVVVLLTLRSTPADESRTRLMANTLRTLRELPALATKQKGVEDLRAGDALRIEGQPYLVLERHRYQERYEGRNWTWHELRILDVRNATTVGLDLEEDDELEAWLQTQTLRLDDLGIEQSALERFDDQESGSITVEGTRFRYADSGEARYFKDEGSEADPFRYWEFEAPNGRESIAVEAWDGARYEAFRMRKVETHDIEPISIARGTK